MKFFPLVWEAYSPSRAKHAGGGDAVARSPLAGVACKGRGGKQ